MSQRFYHPVFIRFCLLAALLWSQTQAHAQAWTRLGENDQLTLYVNRNSIEREGYIRRVWEMQDLKQPDPDGVLSRRYTNEYDCFNKMYRISQMTSYAGPKLSGKKLFEISKPGYWRKIPSGGLFVLGYVAHCVE